MQNFSLKLISLLQSLPMVEPVILVTEANEAVDATGYYRSDGSVEVRLLEAADLNVTAAVFPRLNQALIL